MIEKILRWVVLVGIFTIPIVVPFVVSNWLFFPFITGKGFVFRIVTEIIFALWVLLALADKNYRPKFSWIILAVGSFLGIILLADIFAENPMKALWSNYERMEGFVSIFHMGLYFLVTSSVLTTEKLWLYFFRANILTSILLSFYGFLQLAGKININQGGVRLDGTFGNAAYFGGYMMLMIFISLFLLARNHKDWWKWVYLFAVISDFIVLYNTATRGALLGLLGGILLTAIIVAIFTKGAPVLRKFSVGILLGVLILSGVFYFFRSSSFVQSHPPLARLTSINTNSGDAQARFMVWGMAWQGFKERPILGWGQEGFNFVFNKYYNPNMYNRESWFDRTHNIVFDWLIAGGFLGFLAYFSMILAFFLAVWDIPRAVKSLFPFLLLDKAILTGLGVGYIIQNFFVFDNIVSYIVFFSLLAFLHSRQSKFFSKLDSVEVANNADITRFYFPIMAVILVLAVWFFNARAIFASSDLINALRNQPGGLTDNINFFKSALSRGFLGTQETREQLGQAAISVLSSNNSSISNDAKLNLITLAVNELNQQVKEVPSDARGRVFLSMLLSVSGNTAEGAKQLEEALKLSPEKQSIKLSLASEYLRLGKKKEALALAKSAYESSPSFFDLQVSYLAVAIYCGDQITFDNLVKKVFGGSVPVDNRIVQAFVNTNQYSEAIILLKKSLLLNPNDFQTGLSLAAVYLKAGMRTLCVETIKNLIAKNSQFKEQGEYLIKEIQAGRNP